MNVNSKWSINDLIISINSIYILITSSNILNNDCNFMPKTGVNKKRKEINKYDSVLQNLKVYALLT